MIFNVTTITEHENFYMDTVDALNNDIAIIELAEEVDLSIYTPACLAKTSDNTTFDGKNAWAYGEIMIIRRLTGGGAPCGDQYRV